MWYTLDRSDMVLSSCCKILPRTWRVFLVLQDPGQR